MHKATLASALAIGILTSGTVAWAQYTGPSKAPTTATTAAAAGYTGPSSVPLMTAKQVLDNSSDDQHARLEGRLVSHDGGKNYTFADASGRLPVEISSKHFPAGQPVSADQRVELIGEVDKNWRNKVEFEVDQLRLLP